MEDGMKVLLSIAPDYDGYDVLFEQGMKNPEVYIQINELISNGNLDISELREYAEFSKHLDEDSFETFYETWMENLRNEQYVAYLDDETPIEKFVSNVIEMAKLYDVEVSKSELIDEYHAYISKLGLSNIHFDILEANICAKKLRENQLELIVFFDGFSNADFSIIPVSKVEIMKDLESRIKS